MHAILTNEYPPYCICTYFSIEQVLWCPPNSDRQLPHVRVTCIAIPHGLSYRCASALYACECEVCVPVNVYVCVPVNVHVCVPVIVYVCVPANVYVCVPVNVYVCAGVSTVSHALILSHDPIHHPLLIRNLALSSVYSGHISCAY